MKSIFELAYRYIVPYINRRIVEIMYQHGLSEIEIARKLRITPSAVSRYLAKQRGVQIDLSRNIDVERKLEELAEKIIDKNPSIYEIYRDITSLTLYIMSKKYMCNIHKKLDPEIDPLKCNICPELFGN
ncbi:conserved hypothetical protein [Staphylothermus marinus F1]|uniref:Transcriptional regulator n=1 Tax=Staphylothermus marinus (strain ATCC 43588 / DSM 3639 / JCM 9404 / F1) TaxID=399550 RepID=A3DL68_STAMF|nr:transcriptional regulator [Staphylothermus marinus]ABN69378.1 conserved hypothetical protein [Staphylothermus marinus F1]